LKSTGAVPKTGCEWRQAEIDRREEEWKRELGKKLTAKPAKGK
jgi:hypothetical protein